MARKEFREIRPSRTHSFERNRNPIVTFRAIVRRKNYFFIKIAFLADLTNLRRTSVISGHFPGFLGFSRTHSLRRNWNPIATFRDIVHRNYFYFYQKRFFIESDQLASLVGHFRTFRGLPWALPNAHVQTESKSDCNFSRYRPPKFAFFPKNRFFTKFDQLALPVGHFWTFPGLPWAMLNNFGL